MPQINITIDETQKSKWKSAADTNPKYGSLSHLIRLSVNKELAEDDGQSHTIDIDTDALEDDHRSIENRIAGVEQQLREMHTLLESDILDSGDLTSDIYELLPRFNGFEEFQELVLHIDRSKKFDHDRDYEDRADRARAYGWTEDIFKAIDAPRSDVSHALTVLERNIEEVETFRFTGTGDAGPWLFAFINTGETDE